MSIDPLINLIEQQNLIIQFIANLYRQFALTAYTCAQTV
jgi:hypothetical protein